MSENGFIHFLKAGYGDAFIMHCRKGDEAGIVVVDGGQGVNPLRNKFLKEVECLENIDLMVLTHPDDDHLMGIKKYIENHVEDDPFKVKEIWANCAPYVKFDLNPDVSPRNAKRLSDTLDSLSSQNKIVWKADIVGYKNINYPFADIEIIGPSIENFKSFIERYKDDIDYAEDTRIDMSARDFDKDYNIDMIELAKRDKPLHAEGNYDDAYNASSISIILRCDDFSILMLGDSFASDICESLSKIGYSIDNPLVVDFVKLPHHGSAANISNELLGIIDCQNYLISTNGVRYRHPDREAMANVLCHPKRDFEKPIHFYFNYPLDVVESAGIHIFNHDIDDDLNFIIHEPMPDDDSGLIFTR